MSRRDDHSMDFGDGFRTGYVRARTDAQEAVRIAAQFMRSSAKGDLHALAHADALDLAAEAIGRMEAPDGMQEPTGLEYRGG